MPVRDRPGNISEEAGGKEQGAFQLLVCLQLTRLSFLRAFFSCFSRSSSSCRSSTRLSKPVARSQAYLK